MVISQTKWQCKQHHLGSSNRTPSGMEQTKFGNSLQTMGASWTNMVILAASTIEEKLIIQKWRPRIFGMIRIRFSSKFSWDISQPPIFVVGLVFLTWTVLATRFYRSGGNQISSNGSPQGLHRFPWESIGLLGFNFWDTANTVGRVSWIGLLTNPVENQCFALCWIEMHTYSKPRLGFRTEKQMWSLISWETPVFRHQSFIAHTLAFYGAFSSHGGTPKSSKLNSMARGSDPPLWDIPIS